MMSNWQGCKNILCIRPDNMGDLLMSGPAIRALKESFGARITVLTSSMAAGIARHMPEIDEIMVFDAPWVKAGTEADTQVFYETVAALKEKYFDAAVIFTVYSQNPMPAIMLAYLAEIPKRLAYCRENPYQLLIDWVPDKEPYTWINHQVKRDLDLVGSIGANTQDERLYLTVNDELWPVVEQKLGRVGVDTGKNWMIMHAGVSEKKRQYPIKKWIEAGRKIIDELGYQLVLTGLSSEEMLTTQLNENIGAGSFSAGGLFSLEEFILLVARSPVALSVNTGTIHIAAAVGTPLVVLYALSNPQHTPWCVPHITLPFDVPKLLQSKNEVIRFVTDRLYDGPVEMPNADDILNSVKTLSAINRQKVSFIKTV
jgi:ADP-heptose:LPS heptosyltransferase